MGENDARPAQPSSDNDRDGWNAYWAAQGMPWRTEPEIDESRQQYLTERQEVVKPNIEDGLYPFKGVEPRLTRADVEWLLEKHEDSRGPVVWDDPGQRQRWGPDLRGADLSGLDLRGLPLTRLRGGLTYEERTKASPLKPELAAIHLERADISNAHLEQACLCRAHLEGAVVRQADLSGVDLFHARLDGATLTESRLDGADLRFAFFDNASYLRGIILTADNTGSSWLAGVRWGGADLSLVNWSQLNELADERWARYPRDRKGNRKTNITRIEEFQIAVRANRKLATVLRDQGLNEEADHFAYRGQVMQRAVLRRQGHWLRYLGSLLLDLISGYGYHPERSVGTYAAAIGIFAVLYWCVTNDVSLTHGLFTHILLWFGMKPPPSLPYHLQGYEAVVVSMTSFHGRGFFQPVQSPGDKLAILSAIEAAVGLLIEIVFIATFTQRFFAK